MSDPDVIEQRYPRRIIERVSALMKRDTRNRDDLVRALQDAKARSAQAAAVRQAELEDAVRALEAWKAPERRLERLRGEHRTAAHLESREQSEIAAQLDALPPPRAVDRLRRRIREAEAYLEAHPVETFTEPHWLQDRHVTQTTRGRRRREALLAAIAAARVFVRDEWVALPTAEVETRADALGTAIERAYAVPDDDADDTAAPTPEAAAR